MNVKNNKRRKESQEKIERAFVEFLQTREIKDITVSDLIKETGLNRSTFYANYEDISALANSYVAEIEKQVVAQPHAEDEFAWIFEYILENKELFRIYFKLGISQKTADYKTVFFRNGIYSVTKLWFEDGCIDSPQKMGEILKREYEKLFC